MAETPEKWTWTEVVFHPEEWCYYIRLTRARHPQLRGQLLALDDHATDQLQEAIETGEPFHIDSFLCEGDRTDSRGLDIVRHLMITRS